MSRRPSGCSQVLTCHQPSVPLLSSTGPKDRSVHGVMSDDQRVFKRVEIMGPGLMRQNGERGRDRAKARQASKILEIRKALVSAGCETIAQQAAAFGLPRSTTWAALNQDTRAGPSAKVIKRILSSPNLPPRARRKVEEYVEEKICGRYGHSERSAYAFRSLFRSG